MMHLDWVFVYFSLFYCLLVCYVQWRERERESIFGMFSHVGIFQNACNLNCLYEKYNCCKRCIHCNLSELNAGKISPMLPHAAVQIKFLILPFAIRWLNLAVFFFCFLSKPLLRSEFPFEKWHSQTYDSTQVQVFTDGWNSYIPIVFHLYTYGHGCMWYACME